MIWRVVLWRLGADWRDLLRVLAPGEATVLYFAFGANVSTDVLAQRRIFPFEESDYALADHELRFTQQSPYAGVGFASADHAPGRVVYGKLYRILASDLRRLDYYEGVAFLRRHRRVRRVDGGREIWFYQATDPVAGLAPTEQYRAHLVGGLAQRADVPAPYLTRLANLETRECEVLTRLPGFSVLPYSWEHATAVGPAVRWVNRRALALVVLCVRHWRPFVRWIRPRPRRGSGSAGDPRD